MNTTTDPIVKARREAATEAFKIKMHRYWHTARKMEPCAKLACEHPWYPA